MRPKPPVARLRDLEPGEQADCFALLVERQRSTTRDGKPYFTARFRDAGRTVACMIWADGGWFDQCSSDWREGECYKLRVDYGVHERYGPQVLLLNIRPVNDGDREEGFDRAELEGPLAADSEKRFVELQKIVEAEIRDEGLRGLVLTLLERHAAPLQRLPASPRHFYPFPGGLLKHIVSVTRSCLFLADRYREEHANLTPPLNRDLIVAGAVLHDIGRVLELSDDGLLGKPSVPGRLFGHLFLGRDLVRDTARELGNVAPELLQLLEHIIIAHLNHPEWGSPRLPLIPECLIVHHADDLDAKLEMYVRCLVEDSSTGPFTDRDPNLQRQLFKGRSV